jgi:signal transduction histidine kinase
MARSWARAVSGTSYVSFTTAETQVLLLGFLHDLLRAAGSDPLALDAAAVVGARMVEEHFTNPRTLSASLPVLLTVPDHVAGGSRLERTWPAVIGALTEGYARALQERALREQQEIIDAAVAARTAAERALRASEDRLQAAKDRFIATVSHELRTPLTPIKGYLRLLLSRGEALDPQRRIGFYRVMLAQEQLLERLVNDLLSAAELQYPRFDVALQAVPVSDVVERALDCFLANSPRHVQWQRDDSVGLVFCDPSRLQQVLANLLSNADKYSPEDAPVSVYARREGDGVEIVVRDFGEGIPSDLSEAVFEPFRRLAPTQIAGTGLGLHIARELVESMGGRIWVDADDQPGASFHVALRGGA